MSMFPWKFGEKAGTVLDADGEIIAINFKFKNLADFNIAVSMANKFTQYISDMAAESCGDTIAFRREKF